ncbi:MAG: TonB-dependent receptor [Erythrobacter sp.]|uniref:TonB-dependent receptor n=1 Tax=Erythrobacter sp. TaxID=1042 RepID=UPI00260F16B2|nr:TonB-dependent receptor [Erythrobacter sp.]MDJ0979022.1 TonB-dependent receptor [Erythrobacter sp.]
MKRKLAAYAAGLMACSSFTAPAFAQEIPEGLEAPEASQDVIIVTATRRAQDVQDIPIAVTAISPEALNNQGVDNIREVTDLAPSFTSSQAQIASGSVVLRIRGVGTTSNNIGFESAVGIFIDGAYQSRPGVALNEFVDIERVEVLRGPQGTLFGRNTSAGALNITTKRPELGEFGGFVNAGYGNFDEISLQGAVNVPLTEDTLALRVTGAFRQRDGFLDVVDENGVKFDETNDVDQYLVRAQLGWETDSGFRGRLIADYSNNQSSCCGAIELYQTPLVPTGAFERVGLGANGGNGQPVVSDNPFGQAEFEQALDNRTISASFAPIADIDNYGLTGEIEFPVSDNADLIFIGSYRQFEGMEFYDSDFTALDIFNVGVDSDIETFTAEMRIQGETFGGKLNYMVGGFFSDETIDQSTSFFLGSDYDANAGALFGGIPGLEQPIQTFTGADATGTETVNRFQQDAQSYAIFTHNSLELVEGLELTVGARYVWEEKEGGFTQTETNNTICPATLDALAAGVVPAALTDGLFALGCFSFAAPADLPQAAALPLVETFEDTFSDEELIYTVRLGYEFPDTPINVYASFTHGIKAGGINLDTTAAVDGASPTFESEEVDAWEIGFKSRLIDDALTLNVAAFIEEFTNFQVLEFTGLAFETFNVPKAESKGVEIESLWRVSPELSISASATILDARYPEDCAGDQTDNVTIASLCGFDLTNAPGVIGIMGANYEKPIGNGMDFFFAGQIRLEGDQRTSTQAIVPPDDAAIAAAGSVEAAIDAAPLIIGDVQDGQEFINLRAGLRFNDGAYSIEGFVNNLTDNVVRGVTFNTTLRGSGAANSRSAFSLQPRTYGVVVRAKF